MKTKFLSISILISGILISVSLIFYALCNRYTFIGPKDNVPLIVTFDKLTGTYYITTEKNGSFNTKKRNDINEGE